MPTVIPAVKAVLDDLVARDVEHGLHVAAYVDGQLVLDILSGLAETRIPAASRWRQVVPERPSAGQAAKLTVARAEPIGMPSATSRKGT
jgi:hypothetical protein